jgi:chorismate mutase/prephenate dehydrogenase
MEELDRLRTRIAEIDDAILRLVAERLDVARTIGREKRGAGVPLRDYDVERRVLDRAGEVAEALDLPADTIRLLMQSLIEASRAEQERSSYSSFSGEAGHIVVVGGRGRMGRWLVDFLENQGHRVTALDREDEAPWTTDASIALLATPPEAVPGLLEGYAASRFGGVVCDIASLKGHLAEPVRRAVVAGLAVTSIHPMFGPSARTLSDKVICVCDCGRPDATSRVVELFAETAATLVPLQFEEHDRVIAYVLGLSHLTNLLFTKVLTAGGTRFGDVNRVGSTTFQAQIDTARTVLGEDPDLYFAIQRLNQFTPDLYDVVRREFDELAGWVLDGDRDRFAGMMEDSRRWLMED